MSYAEVQSKLTRVIETMESLQKGILDENQMIYIEVSKLEEFIRELEEAIRAYSTAADATKSIEMVRLMQEKLKSIKEREALLKQKANALIANKKKMDAWNEQYLYVRHDPAAMLTGVAAIGATAVLLFIFSNFT